MESDWSGSLMWISNEGSPGHDCQLTYARSMLVIEAHFN